jgi:hypothetical protein
MRSTETLEYPKGGRLNVLIERPCTPGVGSGVSNGFGKGPKSGDGPRGSFMTRLGLVMYMADSAGGDNVIGLAGLYDCASVGLAAPYFCIGGADDESGSRGPDSEGRSD